MPQARSAKASRRRVVAVDQARFAAGWRLLAGAGAAAGDAHSVHVDIVRPNDLVSLAVTAVECELVAGPGPPLLRPRRGAQARLVVEYGFQHLGEGAVYEESAPVPSDSGNVP